MPRNLQAALAASIVMNLTLAYFGRGTMGQIILLILAFGLMNLCFVIAAVMFVVARISPPPQGTTIGLVHGWISPVPRRSTSSVVLAGLVAGSAIVSLPFGLGVHQYDVNRAKAYCESLRPAIERHKAGTGRYSKELPGILPDASLPRLLREGHFYYPQVDDYRFAFRDPMGIFVMIVYDSRTGEWRVDDDLWSISLVVNPLPVEPTSQNPPRRYNGAVQRNDDRTFSGHE